MTVQEEIDSMVSRLVAGEGERISQRIRLYSSGVSAKLRNAEYAKSRLAEFSGQDDTGTVTDEPEFPANDKVHFFVDSFFAFLYSSFDVISQVGNQKMRLGIDENRVSFKKVNTELATHHSGTAIADVYARLLCSNFFKNLDRYRNCSTHRRQIYLRVETVSISETPGYTTTGDITTVRRILCDNPLTLTPTVNQNRELISYCASMYERACTEITRISRAL